MSQTHLVIPQNPAKSSSPQPAGDAREQLTALWTLRLVLKTPSWHKLLASQHTADDVLAIIGPWIEWPVAMQRKFTKYLYGNEPSMKFLVGDPEHGEESVVECKVPDFMESGAKQRRPKRIAPSPIDWQALDWSELATPFCELYHEQRGPLLKALKAALHRLEQIPVDSQDDLVRNLTLLVGLLKLNAVEQTMLRFCAVANETGWLRKLLGTFRFDGLQKAATLLGGILDFPPAQVLTVLRRDGVLRQSGLLEFGRHVHDLEDLIQLGSHLREVIGFPHDSIAALMAHFLAESPPGQLRREDYPHLRQPHQDLTDLLAGALRQRQAGVNVLLYGPPGTGKTEFARLLAAELQARLYAITTRDDDGGAADAHERLTAYQLAQRFLNEQPAALVLFDEVEDIFSGDAGMAALSRLFGGGGRHGNARKAWLNQVLETNPVPTIWIANQIGEFDPAFLRRFHYAVELGIPPLSVRRRIVGRHLDGLALSPACRDRLAQQQASPAQLETLAKVVGLVQPEPGAATEALLTRALEASMNAMGQTCLPVRAAATGYRLDCLNIDSRLPPDRLVQAAQTTGRLTLCLAGPPGAGKTEFAHYLAEQVDRPLLARRASDLLDKWLGASERNLAGMFRQAQDEQAVLLLDEADSLLGNREAARQHWEVTLVNELLTQMESFDGIFVCATNRFEHLDPAALRRFTAKLRFDYLTREQRWRLFLQETGQVTMAAYPDLRDLRLRLDRLDTLTPGDFATVQRQGRAFGETLTPAVFIERLEDEIRIKRAHAQTRTIGFVQ